MVNNKLIKNTISTNGKMRLTGLNMKYKLKGHLLGEFNYKDAVEKAIEISLYDDTVWICDEDGITVAIIEDGKLFEYRHPAMEKIAEEHLNKYLCPYCAKLYSKLAKYGSCPTCDYDCEFNNTGRLPTLKELLVTEMDMETSCYWFADVNLPSVIRLVLVLTNG